MAAIRNKVEKLNQSSEEQGALHHQCIDELTSHIRIAAQQKTSDEAAKQEGDDKKSTSRSETPTSFVTVIEVNDSSPMRSTESPPTSSPVSSATITVSSSINLVDEATANETETKNLEEKISKNDENLIATIQNLEVKRKIPPRYVKNIFLIIKLIPEFWFFILFFCNYSI